MHGVCTYLLEYHGKDPFLPVTSPIGITALQLINRANLAFVSESNMIAPLIMSTLETLRTELAWVQLSTKGCETQKEHGS